MNLDSRPKPVVLVVIDGWGVSPPWGGNAITLAKTVNYNRLRQDYPQTTIEAAGAAVGLPAGEHGNSEVGHLNIGGGQMVHQSLPAITDAISSGAFQQNETLMRAFDRAKQTNHAVHLLGLASDGGIHSHISHLFALLEMAKTRAVADICIHVITDGRDTAPFVAESFCSAINEKCRQLELGRIGTVSGRYYTMDRDHHWERIEKAYRAIAEGIGLTARSAEAAVSAAYREGFSDEFIVPTVIQGESNQFRPLSDGDSLIFYNFRGDRAREITQALVRSNFGEFERHKVINDLFFVGFTFYQEGLPIEVAFRPRDVQWPLSRVLSEANRRQLHVAESEKYAHVTYFFNGGREEAFKNEDRVVIPSPKAASYDQVPGMATAEITAAVTKALTEYDFVLLNYAAPDMVGHTGNLRAAILSCEEVDKGLGAVAKAVLSQGGAFIITGDHGNVEQMVNPKTGEPDTEHTSNPVPFILVCDECKGWELRRDGTLADVAPTILALLGIAQPPEMTGQSLLSGLPSASPASPVRPAAAVQG